MASTTLRRGHDDKVLCYGTTQLDEDQSSPKTNENDCDLRKADGYAPERMTVVSVETGNYLGAMTWKWPDET